MTFEVGDARHLPYPDGTFDRTLSMLALDTMPEATRALAEMRRVTRPGGAGWVTTGSTRQLTASSVRYAPASGSS